MKKCGLESLLLLREKVRKVKMQRTKQGKKSWLLLLASKNKPFLVCNGFEHFCLSTFFISIISINNSHKATCILFGVLISVTSCGCVVFTDNEDMKIL